MIEPPVSNDTLLLDMSLEQIQAGISYNLAMQIRERQLGIQRSFLEQGRDLIEMCAIPEGMDAPRYKILDYETFEAFVASPEIGIKVRSAHLYRSVVQKFCVEFGFSDDLLVEVGISKLGIIWNHAGTKEQAQFWIDEALALSRSDLLCRIDGVMLGKNEYNAEAEENGRFQSSRLVVDWEAGDRGVANATIAFLVNKLLSVLPSISEDSSFKTAVDVMTKFANEDDA